jgi:hypothetical protein
LIDSALGVDNLKAIDMLPAHPSSRSKLIKTWPGQYHISYGGFRHVDRTNPPN